MKYWKDGFYEDPVDGSIEITDEDWHELLDGQASGQVIVENSEGRPVLQEPLRPALEQPDPALLREQAYRAEADQYLIAYEGYMLEGKISEAEEQKALYLAKKAEIRTLYPDT